MTKTTAVSVSVLCIFLLCGALGIAQPSSKPKPAEQPRLVFRIFSNSFGARSTGVIAAGWDDGLVVFTLGDMPGKDMQAGWISKAKVAETLLELKSAGFFEKHLGPGLAPDESYTTIEALGDSGLTAHRWSENLRHAWGAHAGAKPDFYKFVKMWIVSRNALTFALPESYKPIDKEPGARRRFEQFDSLSEPIKRSVDK